MFILFNWINVIIHNEQINIDSIQFEYTNFENMVI